jgi:hypothetical protein
MLICSIADESVQLQITARMLPMQILRLFLFRQARAKNNVFRFVI